MKTTIFVAFSLLVTHASFANCLTEKQNVNIQSRYEEVVENLENLREAGRSADESQFDKLASESLKLERLIEYQEDHCL